jgi:predicted phage-related endonuclease
MPTLLKAEQRTPEWFAGRLGKASGSRFNDIMARTKSGYSASRKNYAAELVAQRLTGEILEHFTTAAMQFGIDNEELARLEYTLDTGHDVEETGFWMHDILPAGASPDGLVNKDGLLEIKVPNTATHIETLRRKEVPRQYVAQVQGQLWITERDWCDFVSYDPRLPENARKIVIRVERDDRYIAELSQEVEEFLVEVEEEYQFVKNYKG